MDQIGTNVVRTTLKKAKLQKNSCDRTKFFNQSKSVEPHVCALYINHILFIYFLRETAKLYFKVQKLGNATKTVVNIAQEDGFCYSVWHEVHAADPLSLVQRAPMEDPCLCACTTSAHEGIFGGCSPCSYFSQEPNDCHHRS